MLGRIPIPSGRSPGSGVSFCTPQPHSVLHCATWGKHPVPVAGPCHRNKMLRVVSVSAFVNVKGHWRAFHREKRRLLSDSLTAHRGFCGRFKRRLSDTSGKETKCHSHSTRFSSTAKWLATSAFSSLILNALGIKKGKALTQESLECWARRPGW